MPLSSAPSSLTTSLITRIVTGVFVVFASCAAAAEEAQPFQPEGMWIWDNWFVHDGSQWHAFYLQLPKAVGEERRWKDNDPYKHVGHAVSYNLHNWQDLGPAVVALSGTWNDRHIATGSIIRHENQWWMFFTGRGTKGDGVGLALSDDLKTWKTQPTPVFPLGDTFAKNGTAPSESAWKNETRRWIGISDPYVLPDRVGDWFYIVLCSRVLDVPIEESGCLTLIRSKDLRNWESAGIIAWPRCFERMETPQLWHREGRWYLSFGGVLNSAWVEKNQAALPEVVRGRRSHLNYVYTSPDFLQPQQEHQLHFVPAPSGTYIMKVLPSANGRDAALFTISDSKRGSCLSLPLGVRYLDDGSLAFEPMDGHF